jgi:hypothetical protein
MVSPIGFLLTIIGALLVLIAWNKVRCRGKMLCHFLPQDKSLVTKLCELRDDFVIFGTRAYDVYPDFVRVARFPSGWPWILQELVPTALYDERDAVPLDWVTLQKVIESSMNVRSALEENWVRKIVHEQMQEAGGGGFKLNWRKIFPIALIIIGVVGLVILLITGGIGG